MNWTDIQQWESAPLQTYAVECENKQRPLQTEGDNLAADLESLSGSGHTVQAARSSLRKQISSIERQVNHLISTAEICSAGAHGIDRIHANVEDALQLAGEWGMTIDASGNVSLDDAQIERHYKAGKNVFDITGAVNTAQERVNTALTQAQELVDSLSQKLASLEAGTFDNHVHYSATIKSRPTLPPADSSPQENASWWNSLSEEDKQWMIHEHPDVIGNLEGVDYTSRNEANRIMLPRLKEQAEADLQKFYDDNGPYIEPALRSERDRLKNRITALEQIEETLNRENTENPPVPRYLMQLDASGPNILAAVSQNNPDEAHHIGVIVPGMTTSVAGSLGEYDGHATTMRKSAEKAAGPNDKVAMVEFFGYDAPPGAVEASNTIMANNGAPKLASFLNGIDAVREHGAGDAHITVAGHSYGSTTAGIAATLVNDGVIDDLVQFGSPGSGVQDVSEFHVPEGHTYVSAAPYENDMVQGLGPDDFFGKNPDTMDGYKHLSGDVGPTKWGLLPIGVIPIPVPSPFAQHSGYFAEETQANRDIGSVIGGNPNV